ncbi:hypothetical protein G4B88_014531 [Cannabis sativa]|nr:hypothetical protein G4B88_014531 [Cannabis sativa]
MPKILALRAVQTHTAASRSTKSPIRLQQGVLGGVPTTTCTNSFNNFAHTPSFRVSKGHLALELRVGIVGINGILVELTIVKSTKLRERRRAVHA